MIEIERKGYDCISLIATIVLFVPVSIWMISYKPFGGYLIDEGVLGLGFLFVFVYFVGVITLLNKIGDIIYGEREDDEGK